MPTTAVFHYERARGGLGDKDPCMLWQSWCKRQAVLCVEGEGFGAGRYGESLEQPGLHLSEFGIGVALSSHLY